MLIYILAIQFLLCDDTELCPLELLGDSNSLAKR